MSLAISRRAIAAQAAGRARQFSVTAPIGGWNTRDSVDQMDPTDALELTNWLPRLGKVEARSGYEDFFVDAATTLGGTWSNAAIQTLIPLTTGSSSRLVAAFAGGLARVDTGTPAQIIANGTYTVNRWQHTVFADSSAPTAPKIVAVNGTDTPWTYDGTTHAAWAPTGVTPASVIHVSSFKNRIFAIEANSRDFWYGALGAIAGAFTRFPLSGIRGAQGNLLFATSMTRDTGTGPDDFAVFVTTEGQVIVYAGTDPSSASDWSLVGVYQIPRPISSRRAYCALFGDIVIATELDYIFLNQALQEAGGVLLNPSKLSGAQRTAARAYGSNSGWELIADPYDSVLLSNIPLTSGGTQYEQHAVSLQTAAPSKITGWNFHTFCVFNGRLYGAGNGAVYRLFTGQSDDVDGAALAIQLRAQQAWSDFGSPSIKHVKATRPRFLASADPAYGSGIGADFVDPMVLAVAMTGQAGATTLWGDTSGVTTLWGDTAATTTYWAGTQTATAAASREWRLNSARGVDFSYKLALDIKDASIEWLATDYKVTGAGRF